MFSPLFFIKAERIRKKGQPRKALALLQKGLLIYPDFVPALLSLARCHRDLEEFPLTQRVLERVLRLSPLNPIALYEKAEDFRLSGQETLAIQIYRRLLTLSLFGVELKELIEQLEKPDEFLTPTMADLLAKQGHLEDARHIYHKLHLLKPEDKAIEAKFRSFESLKKSP